MLSGRQGCRVIGALDALLGSTAARPPLQGLAALAVLAVPDAVDAGSLPDSRISRFIGH